MRLVVQLQMLKFVFELLQVFNEDLLTDGSFFRD